MTNQNDIAIRAHNISKCYRIGLKNKIHDSFASSMIDFVKSPLNNFKKYRSLYKFENISPDTENTPSDIIWALKNISFELKRGEVLGIVGRNGAGKSTLLKVLSRITDPTSGYAEVKGRVSSLLEVGTGFHPELTGRENVYLNGAILGMSRKYISEKFDEIVDFSGVEKFIDTPVKRYSSGMKVRLAFAVAAHLEPEILVIDEVLAVGDAEFQQKCLGKMQSFTETGRTVLFVSHNMSAVIKLCHSSILLDNGSVIDSGPSKDVVSRYLSKIFEKNDSDDLRDVKYRSGDGRLRFTSVKMQTPEGFSTSMPISGNPIDIIINFEAAKPLARVRFMFTIFNQMGIAVTHCTVDTAGKTFNLKKANGSVVCSIPNLPLPLGQYKVSVSAWDDIGKLDWVPTAFVFNVEASSFYKTSFTPPMRYSTALIQHEWKMLSTENNISEVAILEENG